MIARTRMWEPAVIAERTAARSAYCVQSDNDDDPTGWMSRLGS